MPVPDRAFGTDRTRTLSILIRMSWSSLVLIAILLTAAAPAFAELVSTTDPTPTGWKSWFGNLDTNEILWVVFGFAGQGCFMMRFVYQWYVSERKGRVVIPLPFWYFSVMGGIMLLIYATHRRDPVFMIAQGLGITIYLRNLMLIYRPRDRSCSDDAVTGTNALGTNPSKSSVDPDEPIEKPLSTV